MVEFSNWRWVNIPIRNFGINNFYVGENLLLTLYCQFHYIGLLLLYNQPQMSSAKPRIIKDFEKLDTSIQEQIKLAYPFGFENHLVRYKNAKGEFISALIFENENARYLVRMTLKVAKQIVEEDDDYDENGMLKEDIQMDYLDKHHSDQYEEMEEDYD